MTIRTVIDLGYFNSIQSLKFKAAPRNIDELIEAVQNSFLNLTPDKLNKVFLSLQKGMECVMMNKGGNQFKLPHMKKDQLMRQGVLPVSIQCSPEAILQCREVIGAEDNS